MWGCCSSKLRAIKKNSFQPIPCLDWGGRFGLGLVVSIEATIK
jgi:hypothetical protein